MNFLLFCLLMGILAHREHRLSPEREHFSKITGIGVHDAITPYGQRLLQALIPAKLFCLTGE